MRTVALVLIRLYQQLISPLLGPRCRFYPSCSAYAATVIGTHGFFRGGYLAARRILRCHPWSPGGVDLPPTKDDHHPESARRRHTGRGTRA